MIYWYLYIPWGHKESDNDWATELNYEVGSVCVCLSSQLYWRIRILFFTLYSVQNLYTAGPKVLCRYSNICWVNKKKKNEPSQFDRERTRWDKLDVERAWHAQHWIPLRRALSDITGLWFCFLFCKRRGQYFPYEVILKSKCKDVYELLSTVLIT